MTKQPEMSGFVNIIYMVLGQNAVKKTCREDENCRKKKENVVRRRKMS